MATGRSVVWFELWVPDVVRAMHFYGGLFGWTFRPMPEYDEQYWLIEGSSVGGAILPGDPSDGGARAGTVVFVAVPDLAAATRRCLALGGSPEQGVTAIGDGTSFTLVRDPFGTRLGLWSAGGPTRPEPTSRAGQAKRRHDPDKRPPGEATTAPDTATRSEAARDGQDGGRETDRLRRRQALANLQQVAASGGFDFELLDQLDQ